MIRDATKAALVLHGTFAASLVCASYAVAGTAYVTSPTAPVGHVIPIDTSTNVVGAEISVGYVPTGIAISPDASTVYVTDFTGEELVAIDTATGTPKSTIKTGSLPGSARVRPGQRLRDEPRRGPHARSSR